jgi:hypothetical protein
MSKSLSQIIYDALNSYDCELAQYDEFCYGPAKTLSDDERMALAQHIAAEIHPKPLDTPTQEG